MTRKLETKGFTYVEGEVIAKTDKAILFNDGKVGVWIPLSQIEDADDDIEPGKHLELLLPEWLAKEKGLT